MELKETNRDPSGVHNLAFQPQHRSVFQGDEYINIESDLLENKRASVEDEQPRLKGHLEKNYDKICEFYKEHKIRIHYVICGILVTAYLAVVIAACSLNFQRALPLFIITVMVTFFICWDILIAKYEDKITAFFSPGERYLKKQWFWLKWVLCAALIITIICWLIFDTMEKGSHQLISFGGLVMYVLLMLIFSKYPTRVAWRPVLSGIGMQFILGLLILRTKVGFDVFNWLGIQIQTFLEYSDTGSKFVFGEKYKDHFFAFKVLPIVVFFSTIMSILYHVGFMQWLIGKVGWIMHIFMGTTPIESLVAAGNIFVGQTESPLLVRPYVPYITKSELHAVMTAGFSTIAGSVLGAYISFGTICAYVFMPFSFMMGVDWEDSFIVGGLLGYKTFFNEFLAYKHLSKLIDNREKGGSMYVNGVKQYMTVRSEIIATYALCGFANFGSLGLVIGGLTSIAPSKRKEIADCALRAMIAGTVACFMTACVAGMLTVPGLEVPCHILLGNVSNFTDFPAKNIKLVECCQRLFTSADHSEKISPEGNYSLSSWKVCCQILGRPAVYCT
ncbi:solute carrier family 28 member 3 [Pitangus sulphuratus]|nr:solute carrier family 28 member 3 [Pitangus sulphuratus]